MICCDRCGQWKNPMDFAPLVTRTRTGLHPNCRECEAIMGAEADRNQNKTWLLLETQRFG